MSANFTVYKSSAGSGKTFTLVKEYLRLALADDSVPPQLYKSILAITFTNKAAGEMKERVLSALRELRNEQTQETMMELLCQEMQTDRKIIARRASALLHAILHNYSEFAIGTIDSFVHRIVRTFAIDLRLPLNFNIETNKEKVLAACVDELARKVGEDEKITKVLVEFSRTRMEEDKNWRVDEEIFSFAKKLLDEEGMAQAGKITGDIDALMKSRTVMIEFVYGFAAELKTLALEAIAFMSGNGLKESDFYQSGKGIWNYFRKISSGVFDDSILNTYVVKTTSENKWKSSKSSLTEAHTDYLQGVFSRIEEKRNQGKTKYFTYKALLRNIYSLMVITEIEKIIAAYKEQENIVFISEFNSMISQVIANEPVPFVYERIGEKYKHFLLDEFQDTSRMQWQNLLPLVDNSLASGNFNLVVGDGKQSIYRWRGGDVEQFAGLPKVPGSASPIVAEREQSLIRNYHGKVLDRNFRSRETIVSFNNSLYSWLQSEILPEQLKNVYVDSAQTGRENKTNGFVSFTLIPSSEEADSEVCAETRNFILKNVEEFGYSYSDITVLTRNKSGGKKIADFLVANGIPIVSSESLLLGTNDTIGLIISVLHLVVEDCVAVHEARVLRYLHAGGRFASLSFAQIWEQFSTSGMTLGEWLFEKLHADLRSGVLSSLPLFDLCSAVIRQLELQENDPLFVQYFLDEVLEYSAGNRENLAAFLDWWEQNGNSCSAVLPRGADAVSIMTIHASKGLQFPVVIIPFADWEIYKSDYLWVELHEKELPELKTTLVNSPSQLKDTPYENSGELEKNRQILDNVNLLYVATTRAEDHMHIISRNRNRSGYTDKWLADFMAHKNSSPENDHTFSFGKMICKGETKSRHTNLISYKFHLHNWNGLLDLKLSAHEHPEISIRESRRQEGILFHRAMSRIFSQNDLAALSAWLKGKSLCSSEKAASISDKIASLFKNETFASFFHPQYKSLNEPDILLSEHSIRPDRIVFLEKETWVIDYKTGGEKDDYAIQVSNYGNSLTAMGYPFVRKFIVYIEEERIEEIVSAALSV